MEQKPYDPKKSVEAGTKQATNTFGSGTVGTIVAGIIYSILPDTLDEQARLAFSGAAYAVITLGVSFVHGWWRNRQKHATP